MSAVQAPKSPHFIVLELVLELVLVAAVCGGDLPEAWQAETRC